MDKEDIYKIAITVMMIHLMLIFIFEAFALTSNNPGDTIALSMFNSAVGDAGGVDSQISDLGLCLEGTATESECEARGCVWDEGRCYNALEDNSGIDFGFYDVILSILKIPLYLGKLILFLGTLVFFELILSFKLMPLIPWTPLRFIVSMTLWIYNVYLIYYVWAFISDYRGQQKQ